MRSSFFGIEFKQLKERADALLIPNQFLQYVEIDPLVKNGLPIVYNTSVPTRLIHSFKNQGYDFNEINDMYPFISKKLLVGAEKYETYLDKTILN